MKYLFLLYLFCSLGTTSAQLKSRALDPNKKLVQFLVENWSTDQGLPTNSVLHVFQTNDGYIWISGYNGLIRFDGVKFDLFNQSNTPAFESDVIRKMAQDKDGVLWITTQGSGLLSYRNSQFIRHGEDDGIENLSRALYIDRSNRIWSTSNEKGWFYYDDGEFVFLNHNIDLSLIEVRAIEQGNSGEIYFGTMGEGLFCYNAGSFKKIDYGRGLNETWIYSLLHDNNGTLWIGTSNGLYTLKNNQIKPIKLPISTTINNIMEDVYGNIWLATNDGLFRLHEKNNKTEWLSVRNGLAHNFIIDMIMDFEGTLWVTNYKGGLSRLKDSKFINYNKRGGLKGNIVNEVCEIKINKLLVAYDNGELNLINNGVITNYLNSFSLKGNRIRHIHKDFSNSIWISTYSGLLRIDSLENRQWFDKSNELPDNQIRLTFVDSRKNVWIGTRNAGLVGMLSNGTTLNYNNKNGLTSNLIMSIDEDANGNLMVGTSEGIDNLNILTPTENDYSISVVKGIFSDVVFNVLCDSVNRTWIATENGLYLYHDNKLLHFTTSDGLKDNTFYDVLEDNQGYFWLPYKAGIMKVKKKEILKYIEKEINTINCVVYNKTDGMYSQECNPTSQSIKTTDGSLLFATINGLSQIYPSKLLHNDYIPPVVVEKILVDEKSFLANKSLTLSPVSKRITFLFTALSFYEPSKNQFKYKLEGYDDSWINGGDLRSVSYTNLPHGSYTFKVLASNNDGVWNNQGATFSFKVKPHFYQTTWFYIVLIILFIGVLFVFIQLRIRQLKLWKLRLEKILKDRTQEIILKNEILQKQKKEILIINQELKKQREDMLSQAELLEENKRQLTAANSMKDNIFTIIAHDLRNPLTNLKGMLDMAMNSNSGEIDQNKQQELLRMLSEQTQVTFELLENLLKWSLSQRGLDNSIMEYFLVVPTIEKVLKLLSNQIKKKNIKVINNVAYDISVFADPNMIQTVFRNLISNAVKFTPANGTITINAIFKNEFIEFAVQDTGIGISPEDQHNLFDDYNHYTTFGTNQEKGSGLGLALCKDFVIKNGGTIRFNSNPGQGSTFYFTLPESEKGSL